MDITVNVPTYDPHEGIRISWVEGHEIIVRVDGSEVIIEANSEGLYTLAQQLLTLAQNAIPSGRHIHLTSDSGLCEGSMDLTFQKDQEVRD